MGLVGLAHPSVAVTAGCAVACPPVGQHDQDLKRTKQGLDVGVGLLLRHPVTQLLDAFIFWTSSLG